MVKRIKPEEYGNKTPLKEIIDAQSIKWNDERVAARAGKARSLYASDYGQCMRKVWYAFFPDDYPVPELDARPVLEEAGRDQLQG
jgi:hypothetical protein